MEQAAAAAAVMSRSYTGGQSNYTQQQQYPATSPGRRYMSENELLEGGQIQLPPGATPVVVTSVASGVPGQPGQRSYYVWKEPPAGLPPAYDQYGNQVRNIRTWLGNIG